MQKLMRNKGKKFEWNEVAQAAFENMKSELCEAPVLGIPMEKGMYVLDTDASVVAISGKLHQDWDWNGRIGLRPIAYGSKILSDIEMKYGAPKAEMFAVFTFAENYRSYLGSATFKLRVDIRALSWLKTYSMDQSYICRWIVSLDGFYMIIEHRCMTNTRMLTASARRLSFIKELNRSKPIRRKSRKGSRGRFLNKETYELLPWRDGWTNLDIQFRDTPSYWWKRQQKQRSYGRRIRCIWICCYVRTLSNRNSLVRT